jgi:integrase
MAGRRPLNTHEERALLRVVRRLPPRDRALISTQWFSGYRISEVLSLRIGQILRDNVLVEKIGIAPRCLKGKRGRTRWVPILPELTRALGSYVHWLRQRFELSPEMPLFVSREANPDGTLRPLSREAARRMMHRAFRRAGIINDGRLGTHSLRKTWARHVLHGANNNVAVLKEALHHSSLDITQRYISIEEDEVEAAIRRCDFTRRPRLRPLPTPTEFLLPAAPVPSPLATQAAG